MSDLDDLANANRRPGAPPSQGGSGSHPSRQARPQAPPPEPEYEIPIQVELQQPAGVSPTVWVWLSVGLVVVLGLAFWLINREPSSGGTAGPVAQTGSATAAPSASPTPEANTAINQPASGSAPDGSAPAAPAAGSAEANQPAPTPRGPVVLEDFQEPAAAIDAYFVKRIEPDKVEVKIRNRGKRGVFVRALELFAESDDRIPIDSIRFWLPPGGGVGAVRTIEDMPRRLGDDEGVTAVVQDAEFSDTEPKELANPQAAGENAEESETPSAETTINDD